jgi:hypothetical protein
VRKFQKTLALAALSASVFSSCGTTEATGIPDPSRGCPAGAAMISVADGYLETLCGCAEPAPAYFSSSNHLLCTVTAGTTVLFNYIDVRSKHQILPVGTPAFPPSPLSNPMDQANMIRVHVIKLDAAGTYSFHDGFDGSLLGEIVAL